MMSLELDSERKFAKEFIVAREFFNKIGFEVIGTKDINHETIYLVRRKKVQT
ncbi:MAG: hypothetical protein ACFFG0_18220 [Candidatus Thorarchaeota archaeon]